MGKYKPKLMVGTECKTDFTSVFSNVKMGKYKPKLIDGTEFDHTMRTNYVDQDLYILGTTRKSVLI